MRSFVRAAACALAGMVPCAATGPLSAATVGLSPVAGGGAVVALRADARPDPGASAWRGVFAGTARWRAPLPGFLRTGMARHGRAPDAQNLATEALLPLVAGVSRRTGSATGPVAVSLIVVSLRGDGAAELRLVRFQPHSGPVPGPLRLPGGLARMIAAARYPAAVLPVAAR